MKRTVRSWWSRRLVSCSFVRLRLLSVNNTIAEGEEDNTDGAEQGPKAPVGDPDDPFSVIYQSGWTTMHTAAKVKLFGDGACPTYSAHIV